MTIPRPEYPRPQFVRVSPDNNEPIYECLNGEWEFEFDFGDSGIERGMTARETVYSHRILVPFCPESDLSGVGYKDFMNAVWYRRTVRIPESWAGKKTLLHLQAVDYDAEVWAITPKTDGYAVELVRHRGGFTPILADLGDWAEGGDMITLIVRARDTSRAVSQPRGKQATQYEPYSCFYTRTTGIWQTVWMEAVSRTASLKRPRITPDVAGRTFRLELPLTNNPSGWRLQATLKAEGETVATAETRADLDFAPCVQLTVPEDKQRLWQIGDPFLYDIEIDLLDAEGNVADRIQSYAGLRAISIEGKKVKINGTSVFQRLVLDQGYYPDGVLTAPTDAALIADIRMSMEVGFNGARLHQKVFEERFLYHADRLGYLVWGEFPDWGCGSYGPANDHQQPGITYVAQWLEELERDYSHPSLVGWCALNETFQNWSDRITTLDDATRALFLAAKAMDTTRPVLDASGYSHRVRESDIYDSHDYISEKDSEKGLENFQKRHQKGADWLPYINAQPTPTSKAPYKATPVWSLAYNGQPYFVSEFGGFRWNPEVDAANAATAENANRRVSWGYGVSPETIEDFYHRFEVTCTTLLQNEHMFGYCYTQLTDVYPEENGIFTFDRKAKFDHPRLHAIQTQIAAIEN